MLKIFGFASASKIELLKNCRDYSFDSSNRDFAVNSVDWTCGGSLSIHMWWNFYNTVSRIGILLALAK